MEIMLNGAKRETAACTLHALRDECGNTPADVVILNGYQTDEDAELSQGDTVTFIKKGELPPREALEAMLCARHTPGVYEKVRSARVAVAGLGGLGSNIALSLARTGVGFLHLIDFDVVEPSNLNRQQYGIRHLGMPKAEALKAQIAEINPFVDVVAEQLRLTEQNVASVFSKDEIVCEAFDSPEAKAMLVNALRERWPEKYIVAASGMAGYASANEIFTRKVMGRLYICGDGQSAARPGCGLMAPRVAVCAGHQANMVLRLILGEAEV